MLQETGAELLVHLCTAAQNPSSAEQPRATVGIFVTRCLQDHNLHKQLGLLLCSPEESNAHLVQQQQVAKVDKEPATG
jgi:hypothetical protein